jgi:hypothetical protein
MSTQTPSRSAQQSTQSMSDTQNMPNMPNRQPDMRAEPSRPMMDRMRPTASPGTETKASIKSTELYIFLAAVGGVLLASQLVGRNSVGVDIFRADNAWLMITLLTIGYLVSRGLAKAGSAWRNSDERVLSDDRGR